MHRHLPKLFRVTIGGQLLQEMAEAMKLIYALFFINLALYLKKKLKNLQIK